MRFGNAFLQDFILIYLIQFSVSYRAHYWDRQDLRLFHLRLIWHQEHGFIKLLYLLLVHTSSLNYEIFELVLGVLVDFWFVIVLRDFVKRLIVCTLKVRKCLLVCLWLLHNWLGLLVSFFVLVYSLRLLDFVSLQRVVLFRAIWRLVLLNAEFAILLILALYYGRYRWVIIYVFGWIFYRKRVLLTSIQLWVFLTLPCGTSFGGAGLIATVGGSRLELGISKLARSGLSLLGFVFLQEWSGFYVHEFVLLTILKHRLFFLYRLKFWLSLYW